MADKFNENKIKLSIYNHLFAHYYLWKIYNNRDSKLSFQRMCSQSQYKDNLTENELVEIAKLKEERKFLNKSYRNKNKEKMKLYQKLYKENNKEKIKKYNSLYSKSESRKQVRKRYYENNKHNQNYIDSQNKYYNSDKAKERRKELNKRRYFDPVTNNYYSHRNMSLRMKQFPSLYINIKFSDLKCITVDDKIYIEWKEKCKFESENNKKEWYKNWVKLNRKHLNENSRKRYCKNKEKLSDYKKKLRNRKCFDPIKNEECTYGQLENRKRRNKDLYKNVIIKEYLIN